MDSLDLILGAAGAAPDAGADLVLNYDYDQIPDDQERQILIDCAAAVHTAERDRRWCIGQALNVAKSAIRHGSWSDWIREEFGGYGWSERAIRDFMAAGRLVDAAPDAAKLPGKVQSVLGSAQNADIAPDVAADLLEADKAGEGSGRGGRVNQHDAKRAVNSARGRSVYTDDAPPPASSAPDTGPDVVRPGQGAGVVSAELPYATALALYSAAVAGDLADCLEFAQISELISVLETALDLG